MSGHGRDIHNVATALLLHDGNHGLDALHRAEQVGIKKLPRLRHIEVGKGIVEPEAGIVDPDIDAAKFFHGSIDQRVYLVAAAYVTRHADGVLRAYALPGRLGTRQVTGAEDELCTLAGK